MKRGLTLIEVIIAILVLTVGALGLAASSAAIARMVSLNKARERAEITARHQVELARAAE